MNGAPRTALRGWGQFEDDWQKALVAKDAIEEAGDKIHDCCWYIFRVCQSLDEVRDKLDRLDDTVMFLSDLRRLNDDEPSFTTMLDLIKNSYSESKALLELNTTKKKEIKISDTKIISVDNRQEAIWMTLLAVRAGIGGIVKIIDELLKDSWWIQYQKHIAYFQQIKNFIENIGFVQFLENVLERMGVGVNK